MKIVTPVILEKSGKYSFNACGMYYITEDGYAISAFDEGEAQAAEPYSGIRVERLLDELKK